MGALRAPYNERARGNKISSLLFCGYGVKKTAPLGPTATFFCSELLVASLLSAEFLPRGINPHLTTPEEALNLILAAGGTCATG
jgi:hypothetical protein